MQLNSGILLQGGKYKIIRTLGQGGFGITYLAYQSLMDRKVCIKEFYLKDFCDREGETNKVTMGTSSNAELIKKYKEKFIKEARIIARLDHQNIIRIHDVFEENNTAYYVMDYIEGSNLNDIVKMRGALPEAKALKYIREIGEGLSYIHGQNINHLDVKPGNIMIRESNDSAVLIDFGMSKQYNETGEQTSTTPVGASAGYAPLEMYQEGGVKGFSPQIDVYSLAATLYRLVTGQVPPQASEVMNEGLPELPSGLSPQTKSAIEKGMQYRKKDRPQSISEFLSMLETTASPQQPSYSAASADLTKANSSNDSSEKTELIIPETAPSSAAEHEKTELTVPDKKITAQPERTASNKPKEKSDDINLEHSAPKLYSERYDRTDKKSSNTSAGIIAAGIVAVIVIVGAIIGISAHKDSMRRISAERAAAAEQARLDEIAKAKRDSIALIDANIAAHEYVDLGLSVKWATCNLGASSPEDYGEYYAWGETKTKESCSWFNYRFGDGSTFSKYVATDKYGIVDDKKSLDSGDDAATVRWGKPWRMPTESEWLELKNKCTLSYTTLKGKEGYKVTNKKNGNSIFLPFAGYRDTNGRNFVGYGGLYWSSSLCTGNSRSAQCFDLRGPLLDHYYRYRGHSVRPVLE